MIMERERKNDNIGEINENNHQEKLIEKKKRKQIRTTIK